MWKLLWLANFCQYCKVNSLQEGLFTLKFLIIWQLLKYPTLAPFHHKVHSLQIELECDKISEQLLHIEFTRFSVVISILAFGHQLMLSPCKIAKLVFDLVFSLSTMIARHQISLIYINRSARLKRSQFYQIFFQCLGSESFKLACNTQT